MFTKDDTSECESKPILIVFGIICLIELAVFSLIITRFFINYIFLEQNYLKKKFHSLDYILTLLKISVILCSSFENVHVQIILANIYGSLFLYFLELLK